MSNSLIYDPLLALYLARELDERLRGRACAAAPVFTGDRRVVLPLDRAEALVLDLHPARGWIQLLPWPGEEELEAVCDGVASPPDERRIVVEISLPDRFRPERRALVAELHTNQWNALLVSEEGRILSLAWTRAAGERALRSGAPYEPPAGEPRYGAGPVDEVEARARWGERIEGAPPGERRAALLSSFAYAGAANAAFLLGEAGNPDGRASFERWWWLRGLPPARPAIVRAGGRLLPYPLPVGEVEREAESLLSAMTVVAEAGAGEAAPTAAPDVLAFVRARRAAVARRASRLQEELRATRRAGELRGWGDLLLAKLHEVPRGASVARLEDWEGGEVAIGLDPRLSAVENAARFYDEARRRDRGAARVARLLEEARVELERWGAAESDAARGALPEWAERAMARAPAPQSADGAQEPTQPYRVYRTSGGLEARVGKSARGNDDLTFRHAAPNDVWLHARSVPGSHVILRWPDAEAAPPARDLAEAATLAALFSRARSSGLVAVDWTRRKYVRKPRGAPPGAVIPQRVKTLFVEPDEEMAERLRGD